MTYDEHTCIPFDPMAVTTAWLASWSAKSSGWDASDLFNDIFDGLSSSADSSIADILIIPIVGLLVLVLAIVFGVMFYVASYVFVLMFPMMGFLCGLVSFTPLCVLSGSRDFAAQVITAVVVVVLTVAASYASVRYDAWRHLATSVRRCWQESRTPK